MSLNLSHFAGKHGARGAGDGKLPPGHPAFGKKKPNVLTPASFVKKIGG